MVFNVILSTNKFIYRCFFLYSSMMRLNVLFVLCIFIFLYSTIVWGFIYDFFCSIMWFFLDWCSDSIFTVGYDLVDLDTSLVIFVFVPFVWILFRRSPLMMDLSRVPSGEDSTLKKTKRFLYDYKWHILAITVIIIVSAIIIGSGSFDPPSSAGGSSSSNSSSSAGGSSSFDPSSSAGAPSPLQVINTYFRNVSLISDMAGEPQTKAEVCESIRKVLDIREKLLESVKILYGEGKVDAETKERMRETALLIDKTFATLTAKLRK